MPANAANAVNARGWGKPTGRWADLQARVARIFRIPWRTLDNLQDPWKVFHNIAAACGLRPSLFSFKNE